MSYVVEVLDFFNELGVTAKLTGVMYAPKLNGKLVSVAALTAREIVAKFKHNHAFVSVKYTVVAVIPTVGKLCAWRVALKVTNAANIATVMPLADSDRELWQARMGYVSNANMKMVTKTCKGDPDLGYDDEQNPGL